MNIRKIAKKVHSIAPSVKVEEFNGCVKLTGELDNWDKIYLCGRNAVSKQSLGVLNDIKLVGHTDHIKKSNISDNSIDGKCVDVLVIGGGIVGSAVLRELSRLKLGALMVEKANDIGTGATARNDGCIHVGIDLHKGQQKLKYVIPGNKMYDQLAQDLNISLKRWNQILVFSKNWEKNIIPPLYKLRAKQLGIEKVSYIDADVFKDMEIGAPSWAKGAMLMQTGAVVSPYKTAIALAESAVLNGAEVSLNTCVESMVVENGLVVSVKTNRGTVYPKMVVNASGVFADVIADMAGDRTFTIHPRKGTDLILDKKKVDYALSSMSRSPFSHLPEEHNPTRKVTGHTKGGGVMRTVDGNILIGPDAEEIPDREDYSTCIESIDDLIKKHSCTTKTLSKGDVITYFSGVRAATYEEDFVVRKGIFTKNIIQAAGIQSPGITAAPAIAVEIRDWVKDMLGASVNTDFNPIRPVTPRLADADESTRAKYIASNPAYGEIVCRCEEVSKGEILDALKSPIKVATVDGIKRRVRPGMGRCQGGFCSPLVAQIIAETENIDLNDVLKSDTGSNILFENSKKAMGDKNEKL